MSANVCPDNASGASDTSKAMKENRRQRERERESAREKKERDVGSHTQDLQHANNWSNANLLLHLLMFSAH